MTALERSALGLCQMSGCSNPPNGSLCEPHKMSQRGRNGRRPGPPKRCHTCGREGHNQRHHRR